MERETGRKLTIALLVLLALLVLINLSNSPSNLSNKKTGVVTQAVNTEDKIAPSVTITSPIDIKTTSSSSLSVMGYASDNVKIREVKIKVNDGLWETVSGTSSWSKAVNLFSGNNVIYVQAFDTSDNASPVSAVSVVYAK